jgi:FkbM family methyltransferase
MHGFELLRRKIRTHGWLAALAYTCEHLARPLYRLLWLEPLRHSYSQRGEDLLIDRALGRPAAGFYVDVGANDPRKLSNTKRFYDRGWTGCNIEPDPRRHEAFATSRPRDVNLQLGLAGSAGSMRFHRFEPDYYSTFSAERARELTRAGAKLVATLDVRVETLADILRQHAQGRRIDFLSLDTEGLDLEILESNDWRQFRPRVICVESAAADESEPATASVATFLGSHGYARYAVTRQYGTPLNEIYVDASSN